MSVPGKDFDRGAPETGLGSHKQGLSKLALVCISVSRLLRNGRSLQANPVSGNIPDNLALLVAFASRFAIKTAVGLAPIRMRK
jgi:hypothetical protein